MMPVYDRYNVASPLMARIGPMAWGLEGVPSAGYTPLYFRPATEWEGLRMEPFRAEQPGIEAFRVAPFAGITEAALSPLQPQMQAGLLPTTAQQLYRLLEQLESTLPEEEVLHSLHWQSLQIPSLAQSAAMPRFTHTSLQALHAKIAAAGFIRRMLFGDVSPEAAGGLAHNLSEAARYHGEAQGALAEVLRLPQAAQFGAVQTLRHVMQLADRANTAVQQLYRRTGLENALHEYVRLGAEAQPESAEP